MEPEQLYDFSKQSPEQIERDCLDLDREIEKHRALAKIMQRARDALFAQLPRKRPSALLNTLGQSSIGVPICLEHGQTAFNQSATALNPAVDGSHEQPHTNEANHG